MTGEETLSRLREIGLTEYQSRAYGATVERGTVRLSDLASAADIPKQRIYDVVDALEREGLVEIREGTGGKEATAVPPETALTRLKRSRIDAFADTVDAAIDDLTAAYEETDTRDAFVSVVRHDESVRRHVRRAIQSAEYWLFCCLPRERYESIVDDLADAIERGVTVRLIVTEDDLATDALDVRGNVEVRERPLADTVVAADRAYGVYRGLGAPTMDRPTLITQDENLVEMLQRYCQQYWYGATPVFDRRTDVRRYFSPWLAIADCRAAGEDLVGVAVVVHGASVETGASGTWTGRIVDDEITTGTDVSTDIVIPEIAAITIETDDGERLSVGGWDATVEDVAASWLELRWP